MTRHQKKEKIKNISWHLFILTISVNVLHKNPHESSLGDFMKVISLILNDISEISNPLALLLPALAE